MANTLRMVAGQLLAAGLSAGLYLLHPWLGFLFWPSMALVLVAFMVVGRSVVIGQHIEMSATINAIAKAVDSENGYPPRPATEVVSDIRMLLIALNQQLQSGKPVQKGGG